MGDFRDALVKPVDTHEVRIPKMGRGPSRLFGTTAGYFTKREAVVRALRSVSGLDAPAVYVTLNPVDRDLRARANNRLVTGIAATTSDDNVTRRRNLLIDLDPSRASEIAATDAERDGALAVRDAVAAFLADRGWPDPVADAMTGNGGGLVYRIDVPNDDDSTTLVTGCLAALGGLFDTPAVGVDQSVYNAARITKLLGTVAAKGDDCPDLGRVWQLATGTLRPDAAPVSREQLEDLARLRPAAEDTAPRSDGVTFGPVRDGGTRTWTVPEILTRNGVGWREDRRRYGVAYCLDRCLTSDAHDDGAAIFELASGALDYRCHHNSCRGKVWPEARAALGLDAPRPASGATETGRDDEAAAEPWWLPTPLDAYDVPPFPDWVLPPWQRDYVRALAVETQTPIDLAGLLSLAVLATAAARRVVVLVRPGWREPLVLYVLVILPPGTRKSAVFDAATAPALEYERELMEHLAPLIAECQQAYRLAESRLKAAESAAVKAKSDEAEFLEAEARARREELTEIVVPASPQLIGDDVTPEALSRLLHENRERFAVFSAEGDLFEIMAGRYSDGSPNFAVYLKGHSEDMLKVNRVGRPADYVRRAALTVAITAQPSVLDGLARTDAFRGRGLLARQVYAVPMNLVGSRDSNAPSMPEAVRAAYRIAVRALLAELTLLGVTLARDGDRLSWTAPRPS